MLISLELNELNFETIQRYISEGELPNFAHLFGEYGYTTTTSETAYEHLEPWIQWVTVHTGKSFAEHGVFRLGDIVNTGHEQIWERLERDGVSVGAISPINARNRLENPAYFVPDPWTDTPASGSWLLREFHAAVAQIVNDNASSRVAPRSLLFLLLGAMRFASPANYPDYLKLVTGARKKKWNRALFLDLLLADTFISLQRSKRARFASLFLNAGAHVQHHYMFSSRHYSGESRNPDWYVAEGIDPVLEVYDLYDRIIGRVRTAFPQARLYLMTGLHQTEHPKTTFYWRLKNHAGFLASHGVAFESVEPRMSRDFLLKCASREEAERSTGRLENMQAADGQPLFSCDRRGEEIFVELTYDKEITEGFVFRDGNRECTGLAREVAFVAIKNGEHSGEGYFLDTGAAAKSGSKAIPLKSLFDRIYQAAVAG